MVFLEKVRFALNEVGTVLRLIEKWVPSDCTTEKHYRDSLYDFLHAALHSIQIIRQYGRGRSRVDLMIGDKVMVKIKHRLTSSADYQRLVGQLAGYKEWDKLLIIVVTGETDPALFKQLSDVVDQEFNDPLVMLEVSAYVVQK